MFHESYGQVRRGVGDQIYEGLTYNTKFNIHMNNMSFRKKYSKN